MQKTIKKLVILTLCFCVGFTLAACSSMPYSSVDAKDYVKVGKYKGLKKKETKVKVTDKEVESQIKQILNSNASMQEVKKGVVKNGDTVKIDYTGKIDGKEFKGGSAKDQFLAIGSNQFIKGFESGLIGMKIGTTKTLHLTFPKDYSEKKLAGKKVEFKVKVNAKQKNVVPKLDENFIASQMKETKNKKVKTVSDYRKYIKKEIFKQKKKQKIENQKQLLWADVTKNTTVKKDKNGKEKYPEKEVDRISKQIKEQYNDYAKQNNMTLKKFLKSQMNISEKTLDKQIEASAQATVKDDLTVCYIADKENISVSSNDCDKFVKKQLKLYGYHSEEEFEKQTGKSYSETIGEETLKMQALKEKVLEFIYENAK